MRRELPADPARVVAWVACLLAHVGTAQLALPAHGQAGSDAARPSAVAPVPSSIEAPKPAREQDHVAVEVSEAAHEQNDATAQARAFFEIGAQAYELGDYASALEAFHEAYARTKRPGLLFSIAQAHRRAFFVANDGTQLAHAIAHYRKYLAADHKARRSEAERALAQLVPLAGSTTREAIASGAAKSGTKLMITSPTPGAVLRVDEALAPRLPYVAAITPGTHRITLSAPGFHEQSRELPLPEGAAFALDIALEELPGSLAIASEANSQVWVDGRLIGVLPLPALTLNAGAHQVSLRRPGYRVATRTLVIERGGSQQLELPMVHTKQRRVSIGLIWGSTASLLAAAGTAIAAYARQRAAATLKRRWEAYAASPDYLGGSESELERYNRLRSARNRLRSATIGLASVGLACALLGGALFAFDRREVPELFDQGPRPRKPTHKATPIELIAAPSWDGERFGIDASARF